MAVVLPEIGDRSFIPEIWTLYGIGVTVLLLRLGARIKTVGVRGFQGDDYFSILTLVAYTVGTLTVHQIFYTGTNVEALGIQQTQRLTSADVKQFERGSKEQMVAWYAYTALIWSMKATMLFFFNRLTAGLWQHRFLKWVGGFCAVTYLAVVLTITFGCFPTQNNWQVIPDPGPKCTLKLQNFLVTVVLNVITDSLILAIPIPLLWTLRVPLRRKIIIALLLCSGLFIITAAIIRVVLTLDSNPSATNINRWGVREIIVSIITINAPILRPLLTRKFWTRQTWKDSSVGYGESRTLEGDTMRSARRAAGGCPPGGGKGFELSETSRGGTWESARKCDLESGILGKRRGSISTLGSLESCVRTDSRDRIVQGNERTVETVPLEVNVQTEVLVTSESADGINQAVDDQRDEGWVQDERQERGPQRSASRGQSVGRGKL